MSSPFRTCAQNDGVTGIIVNINIVNVVYGVLCIMQLLCLQLLCLQLLYYTQAMYVQKFNDLDAHNKKHKYVTKSGATNVLFIGGCRSFAYSIFFEELCKHNTYLKNAQYGIGAIAVHLNPIKTPGLTHVVENADIIICEQIRNFDMLNTSTECEQNMFNNFNIKPTCRVIHVPNLECEITPDSKLQITTRLTNHCKKYNFEKLATHIHDNSHVIHSLFVTCNHPSNALFCQLMKELIETHFNVIIDHQLMSMMQCIRIFDS